jgi:hypothetical protein
MEKSKIYHDINEILSGYVFETNRDETIKSLLVDVNEYLVSISAFPRLIDATTPEMTDRGGILIKVSFMGTEMSLEEYLRTVIDGE